MKNQNHPRTTESPAPREPDRNFLVVIPARNEEKTVARVAGELISACGREVLVVDDASTDRTRALAEQAGAKVLSLALQCGAWNAIQTGFRYALKHGYRYAVTFDADGQHRAEAVFDLADEVVSGRADVAIGSCPERVSTNRHLAWKMFRLITGLDISGLTSGLRSYNETAMKLLLTRRATILDYQDVGVLLLLRKYGLTVRETPVDMEQRAWGGSKVFDSWFTVGKYMAKSLSICTSKMFHRHADINKALQEFGNDAL